MSARQRAADDDEGLPQSWLRPAYAVAPPASAHIEPQQPEPEPEPEGRYLDRDELPEWVFVPAFPIESGEGPRLRFELWQLPGRVTKAVGYTTLKRLVDQLGEFQPWIRCPTARLYEDLAACQVTVFALDPPAGEVGPRWNEQDVQALMEANRR